MNMLTDLPEEGREIVTADANTIALLNRGEIDVQISTAKKYPRSIKRFRDEALQMVTLNDQIAAECIYSLPRDGKVVEGPSARFGEVAASAWGNCRAGARVVSDQGDFVTAQGVFHDLERNVAITYEVQRRITGKNGKRFSADMIGVTGNAASSIALRNAILKGIPKAFWADLYNAARQCAMGDFKTLANRRAEAIKAFQAFGIKPEQVFAKLAVPGIEDVSLEGLLVLRGLLTALRDGDTTPEQAFAPDDSKPVAAMPVRKSAGQPSEPPPADPPSAAAAPAPTTGEPGTQAPLIPPIAASQSTGAGISTAQVRYLQQKFASLELSDEAVLATVRRAGGTALDTSLSIEQFDAIKSELIATGA